MKIRFFFFGSEKKQFKFLDKLGNISPEIGAILGKGDCVVYFPKKHFRKVFKVLYSSPNVNINKWADKDVD